jgi:hypothetical protein
MKHASTLVLVAAAAFLAAAGLWLVVHPRTTEHRPTARTQVTSDPPTADLPSAAPTSPPPRSADPVEEPDAPPSRKASSDQSIQKGLEATMPGNLPDDQEKELVALGWSVIRADLTGRGRQKWPDYFPGSPSRTRYTGVRMRAGVARGVPARSGLAQVIVIWTGKDPRGREIPQERTAVCLAWNGSRWQPRIPPACTTT